MYDLGAVPSNLAKIIAAVGSDLESPTIIADIDKVVQHLLKLREVAVDLHGETAPAAINQSESPPVRQTEEKRQGADATLASLIARYKNDKKSPYRKVKYHTRLNYESNLRRIEDDYGPRNLADLKAEDIDAWHKAWTKRGNAVAHGLITMLRQLFSFGTDVLKDSECERLSFVMHRMQFPPIGKREGKYLTAPQANLIRAKAHAMGYPMVALAQALQFDCKLRQKEVIGEWVPPSEPGPPSDVINEATGKKWMRGLRWSDIDDNLILKKRINLRKCPMVMEELERIGPDKGPRNGPMIIDKDTRRPYRNHQFRRHWRAIATAAGVPSDVFNMDSRGGEDEEPSFEDRERESAR
jgi:hypothetical protein